MNNTKQHIANKILQHCTKSQDLMLELLKTMVAIETPSKNLASQEKIFSFLQDQFNKVEYQTIRVKGAQTGGYLYAYPKSRDKLKPTQMLLGHCDTVWDINTLKNIPITQLNGRTTGPGIFDMKAGITQILFALKCIKDLSLNTSVTPIVLINSDEEIGSQESTNAIKRLSKIVSRVFVLEPPLGLDGKLKTARKGIGRFTITVKGKAAHAGLNPEKGVNAIVELAHLVQKLYAMNNFEQGITVNVGMIEGGNSPNVIAPESKAVIDVRVYNIEDGNYITDKIHQLKPLNNNVELIIEGGIGRPPMEKTDRNQKLWDVAKKNAKLIGISLKQATAGGGSDGNTTSQYTATLDGLGTTGDGAHAEHEFIFTNKIVERTALLTLLLLEDL